MMFDGNARECRRQVASTAVVDEWNVIRWTDVSIFSAYEWWNKFITHSFAWSLIARIEIDSIRSKLSVIFFVHFLSMFLLLAVQLGSIRRKSVRPILPVKLCSSWKSNGGLKLEHRSLPLRKHIKWCTQSM